MNIFSNIPSLSTTKSKAEADAIDAEQAKRDRIAYHRDHVRNGPANFRTPTNGQLRRAEERRRARKAKTARKRQVRAFFKSEREAAVLRGHLQAAGILPYSSAKVKRDPLTITNSVEWLVRRFSPNGAADRLKTEGEIKDALTSALNRWQSLTGNALTALDGSPLK